MSCFTGLLSLSKYCGLPEPIIPDGYLQHLPGISTEMAQKIASGDQQTFFDVWESVEVEAWNDLKSDVVLFLSETVNFAESQYRTMQPRLDVITAAALPVTSEQRGVRVELPYGKHVRLALHGLWIDSDSATDATITVRDAHTLDVIETFTVSLQIGLQYYPLSKEYSAKELLISMDGSTITSRYFEHEYSHTGFYECQKVCCYDGMELYIRPAVNGEFTSQGLGLWIDAEIICSIDSFICEHKKKMVQAMKNKYAEKLMEHKQGSHRLNIFTSTNLEFTEKKRDDYKKRYEQLLRMTLSQINLSQEGACFDCQDNYRITTGYAVV